MKVGRVIYNPPRCKNCNDFLKLGVFDMKETFIERPYNSNIQSPHAKCNNCGMIYEVEDD